MGSMRQVDLCSLLIIISPDNIDNGKGKFQMHHTTLDCLSLPNTINDQNIRKHAAFQSIVESQC